jgi:hypothetical protein
MGELIIYRYAKTNTFVKTVQRKIVILYIFDRL